MAGIHLEPPSRDSGFMHWIALIVKILYVQMEMIGRSPYHLDLDLVNPVRGGNVTRQV